MRFTDPFPRSILIFDGQRFLYRLMTVFGHRVTALDVVSTQIETVDSLLPVAPSQVRKASWCAAKVAGRLAERLKVWSKNYSRQTSPMTSKLCIQLLRRVPKEMNRSYVDSRGRLHRKRRA